MSGKFYQSTLTALAAISLAACVSHSGIDEPSPPRGIDATAQTVSPAADVTKAPPPPEAVTPSAELPARILGSGPGNVAGTVDVATVSDSDPNLGKAPDSLSSASEVLPNGVVTQPPQPAPSAATAQPASLTTGGRTVASSSSTVATEGGLSAPTTIVAAPSNSPTVASAPRDGTGQSTAKSGEVSATKANDGTVKITNDKAKTKPSLWRRMTRRVSKNP